MYSAPKGTNDILPEDQPYWWFVAAKIRYICKLYGYAPIDVPLFEETSLFARGVGENTDIVEKEMYTFTDRGGNSLTLRPEFTAGIVRAYTEHGMHMLPQPLKFYSMGPAFRYERPQKGRYRQFNQINVEALGEIDPGVDLEVILLAWQLCDLLGLKGLVLQLNSTGCPQCRPAYLEQVVAYYQDQIAVICADCRRRLQRNPLRLLDCKTDLCQPVIAQAPPIEDALCGSCHDHFTTLRNYLEQMDLPYTTNHRLVRGLDYYTKTVFEILATSLGAQNAILGGGRYDGLVEELGGPPTPAVGFAMGIERIILTIKNEQIPVPGLPQPRVFVAYQGMAAKAEALKLLQRLRRQGISATCTWGRRSLKAQMKQANRSGATYTLILGDRELETGQITLRQMADSKQITVPGDRVLAWLAEHLKNPAGEQRLSKGHPVEGNKGQDVG